MSIFQQAASLALPPNPTTLTEGPVSSDISAGMSYGSDPAKAVKNTVNNVSSIDPNTASTLGPNFDRFSVPENPQSFGVVGNLFQSGQDLVPMSNVLSNFGGTFIGDELSQVNVENLLRNPGQELSTLGRNLSNSVENQVKQQTKSLARSVVQDVKDVLRGAVNTLLDPNAAGTTNLGVTDSRISYAFFGPVDANTKYAKGTTGEGESTKPVGYQGVEPLLNPHYIFRLNLVANKMGSAGDESLAQSRLLLDKEFRMGVSKAGKKEVTLSAILSKFGGFSQTNPTPYRAADFLWLKYYNIIPLTRLITLRRYMFPIQDNLTRSPYLGGGTSRAGSFKINGWGNNPVSQMVTYFGGGTDNSLSEILKIAVTTSWEGQVGSGVQDVQLFNGSAVDFSTLFQSSKFAEAAGNIGKAGFGILGSTINAIGGTPFTGASFMRGISAAVKSIGSNIPAKDLAAGILAYFSVIDKKRFAGLASFQDLFNPYAQGGYLSDLYREPYNRIMTAKKRVPGLSGGLSESINIKFQYSLKAIGHINAKAAMLDIMSNVLATTHYRGSFWGGEARFYLNKGIFPILDEDQSIAFVRAIWTGDFGGAVQQFQNGIRDAFGGQVTVDQALQALLAMKDANTEATSAADTDDVNIIAQAGYANTTASQNADAAAGTMSSKLKEMAAIDLLAGLFGLSGGDGNASIPQFQALKTGAPIGEWHLTVGNPFKPIAVIGNLVCSGVDITFNDELGPDDFPTEMNVSVTLQPGMPRANQDIESIFNDGFGPLYIPRIDKFNGQTIETVQEEIGKAAALSAVDTGAIFGEAGASTIESLANSRVVSADQKGETPSAHMLRYVTSEPRENP